MAAVRLVGAEHSASLRAAFKNSDGRTSVSAEVSGTRTGEPGAYDDYAHVPRCAASPFIRQLGRRLRRVIRRDTMERT